MAKNRCNSTCEDYDAPKWSDKFGHAWDGLICGLEKGHEDLHSFTYEWRDYDHRTHDEFECPFEVGDCVDDPKNYMGKEADDSSVI